MLQKQSHNIITWFLVGFVVGVGVIWFILKTEAGQQLTASEEFLFAQTTESGSLLPTTDDNVYTLTLSEPDDRIVYFTDRPYRIAGTMAFVDLQEQVFDDPNDPPNAALVYTNDAVQNVVIPVELRNPEQAANGQVTYEAMILGSVTPSLTSAIQVENGIAAEGLESGIRFDDAELFIDSSHYDQICSGQIKTDIDLTLDPNRTNPSPGSSHWGHISENIDAYSGEDGGDWSYAWDGGDGKKGPSFDIYYGGGDKDVLFKMHVHCWQSFWSGSEVRSASCEMQGGNADKYKCEHSTYTNDKYRNDSIQFTISEK